MTVQKIEPTRALSFIFAKKAVPIIEDMKGVPIYENI